MNPIDAKLSRFGHNKISNFSVAEATEKILSNTTEILADALKGEAGEQNGAPASDISRFSRPLLTVAAVLTILIMIVGIFGNLLTIVALIKCPKVRNVAAAFIISLCLADFIFCVIVLPFNAFRFINGTWTHGDFLCKLVPFIQYANVGISLLMITMITINRYVMITHHSLYARIYKKHWIALMLIFCWLFAYGMQLPTLLNVWGIFGYDEKLGTCSILKDSYGRSSKTALFIIAFLIPCIIIIICYTRIFWVVHKSEKRMKRHASVQNSIPNNLRGASSQPGASNASITSGGVAEPSSAGPNNIVKASRIKDQRDIKSKRNEWRITKMVLAIFLSFVACYLPITIMKVADPDVNSPGFHILAYLLLYLSSCINPIIYVIMNKQYRQAYKTVLMCRVSSFLNYTGAGGAGANAQSNLNSEKWKDIGYSFNHSRTQVSQVSCADPSSSRSSLHRQDSPHPNRLPVIPDEREDLA